MKILFLINIGFAEKKQYFGFPTKIETLQFFY
jgi:hypothetical protein